MYFKMNDVGRALTAVFGKLQAYIYVPTCLPSSCLLPAAMTRLAS